MLNKQALKKAVLGATKTMGTMMLKKRMQEKKDELLPGKPTLKRYKKSKLA